MKPFSYAMIFMGMAWSYPSSSDQRSLGECVSKIPNEILTGAFQNLDSFETLDRCSRANEKWEKAVAAHSKYIYRHFNNHELVNALLHGLPDHLSTLLPPASTTTHIFETLRSRTTKLCFADKYLLTIKAAEYGDVETLERLFEQEYGCTLLQDPEGTIDRFESDPLLKSVKRAHSRTVKWLWDKIVDLDSRDATHRLMSSKVDVKMAALQAGYDVDATSENPFFEGHLITAARQGPNVLLFEKYAKLALNSYDWSPDLVWNATAACRSCNGEQLQKMVHFYQHDETILQEKMMQALEVACGKGSFEMVRYLRENNPYSFNPLLCIQQAAWNANFDLVSALKKDETETDLYFQSTVVPFVLNHMAIGIYPSKFVALLEFLTKEYDRDIFSSLVPAAEASYYLAIYSGHVCGNEVGLETVSRLSSLLNPAEVESTIVMNLIKRSEMPSWGRYINYCRANETTQILEFLLDNNYFTATQEHLNAALKTGRLDIVKMIYNKGIENGAPLEINSHSLLEMLPTALAGRTDVAVGSWQSPELLKYVLEKAFGGSLELKTLSDADKEIVGEFIHASNTLFSSDSSTVKYDCYYEMAKDLIKEE